MLVREATRSQARVQRQHASRLEESVYRTGDADNAQKSEEPGTAVAMCAYKSSPSRGDLSLYPTLREAQRALSDAM